MAIEWFVLSLTDGVLQRTHPPRRAANLPWNECDIENLIALNPRFLDVQDHLPLRLCGISSTYKSPDQIYVDELGRIVVVEVKSGTAGLKAVAQAFAYAEHWRILPPSEVTEAAPLLWDDREACNESKGGHLKELTRLVVRKFDPKRCRGSANDMRSFARRFWGDCHLPLVGAPARGIVIAKDFDDESRNFAQLLTERRVGIELLSVDMVTSGERVYVKRNWAHRDPNVEPTWRQLRRAWRQRKIRQGFVLNGWADGNSWDSFTISAEKADEARIWLWASDSEAEIQTTVPDGWYSETNPNRRTLLREKFLDALPDGFDRSERYLTWDYKLPAQQRQVDRCILAVADAVKSVLVPNAPSL